MLSTQVTRIGSKYGVRVLNHGVPVLEVRVTAKSEIQPAIKDMLRTLNKLGYDSAMASASRHRDNHRPVNKHRFIWLPRHQPTYR